MSKQIFVNLPVADLQAAITFFTALGFSFNPQWTDDTATCMIVADNIFVMLLKRDRFQTFTPKPVSDAKQSTEVLICLSADSRAAVDTMVQQAVAAGGSTYNQAQDHGFMYIHGFQDLDGHLWEVAYMAETPPAA